MIEAVRGLRCKACDHAIAQADLDGELCNECMHHVYMYNADIEDVADEVPIQGGFR
jgi:hypothetical protein